MRISVNGGHTPASPGASGYIDELTEDRKFKDRLIAALRARGHEVGDSTADDWADANTDLAQQCQRVNAFGADLAISIHFNAGGGTGPEVLAHRGDAYGMRLAAKISANLARALGLPDRGAKDGSWLYFVNNTNPTAVLIETCFVDRSEDKAAYDSTSWDALCDAVCDAVDGATWGGESPKPQTPPDESGNTPLPVVKLQAKTTDGTVLQWTQHPDYAGWDANGCIAYLCASCAWPLEVQAHTQASGWLPMIVNPDNINDPVNGCVGDGSPITGLKMYVHAPNGDKVVMYRTHQNGGWYPYQRDTETGGGQDGYAGDLSSGITRVEAFLADY